MEHKAKIFARWVLAIHLSLIVGVIAVVFFASREVYGQARKQAIDQAEASQQLLARQTAAGIKAFYDSIRDDLDLIHHAEDEEPTTQASTRVSLPQINLGAFSLPLPTRGPQDGGGGAARDRTGNVVGQILWLQLDTRAALLFSVDADRLEAHETTQAIARNPLVRVIGPPGSGKEARTVMHKMRAWLADAHDPKVSTFQEFDGGLGDGNVVCVPAAERANEKARRLLVAYVKIEKIRSKFLDKLNPKDNSTSATLADENMLTMVSSDPSLVGINALKAEDPHVRALATRAMTSDDAVTLAIEEAYRFGSVTRNPRMMTIVPVPVMGHQRWYLMVSSRLSEVDAVVQGLFRRALYWAIVVVIAMTATLVSTGIFIVRGRARTERMRHELLTRELNQAREIQKAWLPQSNLNSAAVDISAVNRPASHISGDFYNWFKLPDGRLVVIIGDVTGHGMSAAFLMATTQLLVRTTMMRVGDPGICMDEVNQQLCSQIFNGQFVTMLIVVLDLERGEMQVATAGHYPPLLNDGKNFRPVPLEPQIVLGVDAKAEYQTREFALPPGASVLLYTDGVLDVESPRGTRFGKDGLAKALPNRPESARAVLDALLAGVDRFRVAKDLPDDLTVVAIQLANTPAARKAVGARA